MLEDPTDAEQDASDYNKRQLERIEDSIQSTQSVITEKMDDLWELYNDKVKPFENTDDSYKELASDVKDDYTGFFEGLGEALMDPIKDSYDLLRGFVSGAVDLVKGVAILASDAGIVLVSSQIPDPIEPAFIKDKNDEIVEDYSNAAKQVIDNPLIVAEMVAQSVSDTVEEEGAMFATGEALTALIPVAGGLKYAKEGAVLKNVGKGKSGNKRTGNKTDKVSNSVIKDGSHMSKNGNLKPNVKYKTGEYEYLYETDNMGRLKEFSTDDLKLTKRESRLPHNSNTPGKKTGDHAGHLAGDRFGGSPELDNLVSQSSSVNLSKYKKLENQWAKAIEEGKRVSVNVKINYEGTGLRPTNFEIKYNIDGNINKVRLKN